MTVGPLVAAAGLLWMSRIDAGAAYWTDVLPPVVLFGLGLCLLVAPLTATALGALDDRYAGVASGVNNAVARAAGLLSVAILPLAAGIGTGDLTNAADLHPAYRNSLMICAALMIAGGGLAAILIPARLRAHVPTPAPPAADRNVSPVQTVGATAAPASPIRTYCDISGPPVHPRD